MKGEENAIPPWEEEDGIYGIMSRVLRNVTPTFIWTVRNDAIDFKFLRREQMVNHHQRAGSFTTKVRAGRETFLTWIIYSYVKSY